MIDIETLKEINYRLDSIITDDDMETLAIEYNKLKNKMTMLEKKLSDIKMEILDKGTDEFGLAMDRVKEKLKDHPLEKLIEHSMSFLVNDYSMDSLSHQGIDSYLNVDSKTFVICAYLNTDEFYALQDVNNLKKILTPNFIENSVLDSNIYRTDELVVKYNMAIYNLHISKMEKKFIQDGIYEHFNIDIDYVVDYEKVYIHDLENDSYIIHVPLVINSANWDSIINEIKKGKENE
jgi:hypothetical protein